MGRTVAAADVGRDVMTKARSAALRKKWKERVDPRPCDHINLKLEQRDDGSFTGTYYCLVCGESVAIKPQ
jgi:hypothetical protein